MDIKSGTHGECSWEINNEGILRLFPTDGKSGTLASQMGLEFTSPWEQYGKEVNKVVVEPGVEAGKDMAFLFYDLEICKEMDLSGLDTSNAVMMSSAFAGCSSLESLDLRNFNTENVKDVMLLFEDCKNLKHLDMSGLEFPKMERSRGIFKGCDSLRDLKLGKETSLLFSKELPDIKGFEGKSWKPPKLKEQAKNKDTLEH